MFYSTNSAARPQHDELERQKFEENLRLAQTGRRDDTAGVDFIGGGQDADLDQIFADLDALVADPDGAELKTELVTSYDDSLARKVASGFIPNLAADGWVYERKPAYLLPWDKARAELGVAQDRLANCKPDTPEWHRAKAQHRLARETFDREVARDQDDTWRDRRDTDRWRAQEGRVARNAERRQVRDQPNRNLAEMSEAERLEHRRLQKLDSKYRERKRKAGWTEPQIEAGLQKRRTKRAKDQ